MRSEKLRKQSQIHDILNYNGKKNEVNSRDLFIWDMFRNPTKKATNDKKVIVLD